MFNKIDYYEHYYNRGYRNFEERNCVICGYTMIVPKSLKSITTCCEYCRNVKITLKKSKGKYTLCRVCDKPIWSQPKKNHQFCSKKCKDLGTSIFTYKRNIIRGNYKKYYGDNWLSQRERARKRDNYTCQRCGITEKEYGKELSVHHIKPFILFESYEEANKLENLLSVCEPCHRKIHSGDNHPSKYIVR